MEPKTLAKLALQTLESKSITKASANFPSERSPIQATLIPTHEADSSTNEMLRTPDGTFRARRSPQIKVIDEGITNISLESLEKFLALVALHQYADARVVCGELLRLEPGNVVLQDYWCALDQMDNHNREKDVDEDASDQSDGSDEEETNSMDEDRSEDSSCEESSSDFDDQDTNCVEIEDERGLVLKIQPQHHQV